MQAIGIKQKIMNESIKNMNIYTPNFINVMPAIITGQKCARGGVNSRMRTKNLRTLKKY